MSDLIDRLNVEKEFAQRIAKLSAKHRKELEELLGDPPRIENVPDEFWQKVEQEERDELVLILTLIYALSAMQHGLSFSRAEMLARSWAGSEAVFVSSDGVRNRRSSLTATSRKWDERRAGVRKFDIKTVGPQVGDIGKYVAALDGERIGTKEVRRETLKHFGPVRPERIAITQTTRAATRGGSAAIGETVGFSEEDIWVTAKDDLVCPICMPMDKKPRSIWSRYFPNGPDAHERCRCWIQYANQKRGT